MIISLYSYKGGTGRTQLCANLAAYFYEQGLKILLWDWDLDAPGLHYFFGLQDKDIHQSGTLEVLETFMHEREIDFSTFSANYILNLRTAPNQQGKIDLIPCGNYTNAYAARANQFDWNEFEKADGFTFLDKWRDWLQKQDYDYILLDSRTGVTDYSGICMIQLPDLCLLLVTPHHQSYEGNARMMRSLKNSKFLEAKGRTPLFLPILSRLDTTDEANANKEMLKFKVYFAEHYNHFFKQIGGNIQKWYDGKERDYINETVLAYEAVLAHYENLVFPFTTERLIIGYPEKVGAIAAILQESQYPIEDLNRYASNLRYSTLHKEEVIIGATHYKIQSDLKHCILWIQVEKSNVFNQYTIQVFLKTDYIGPNKLGTLGENLCSQPIPITVPAPIADAFLTDTLTEVSTWKAQQLERLFQIFFVGDVNTICLDFIQLLDNHRIKTILMVLASEDKVIANLPFERILPYFLVSKNKTVQKNTPHLGFSRSSLPSLSAFHLPKHKTATPLNVLFVAALPENLASSLKTAIEVMAREQYQLIEALEALHADSTALTIEFLYPASLTEIEKALRARQHDVVHISAYSAVLTGSTQPVLYLEDEWGELQVTYSSDLASLLKKYPTVRLLILSLLEQQALQIETPIEPIITYYGIPSLLTTRFTNTEIAHKTFISTFYTQLSKGFPVMEALNHAQTRFQQMITPDSALMPIGIPVTIYLNEAVGALTDLTKTRKTVADFSHSQQIVKHTHTRLIGGGFIGRKRYLIRMQQLFRQGKHLCLYGLGGLGKTTLAEAFAYHFAAQEKAEVLIFKNNEINESGILDTLNRNLLRVNPKIASKIGPILASQTKTTEKLQTLINNYPKRGRLILLFDNCEYMQQNGTHLWEKKIQDVNLTLFLNYLCANTPKNGYVLFTTRYKLTDLETVVTHLALDKMTEMEQDRLLNHSEILRYIPTQERPALYQRLDGHPRSYQLLETLLKKDRNFKWHQIDAVETEIFSNLMLQKVYDTLSEAQKAFFKQICLFTTRTPFAILEGVTKKKIHTMRSALNHFQDWSLLFVDEKAATFYVHHLTRKWMLDVNNNIFTMTEKNAAYLTIAQYFVTLLGNQDILDNIILNNYIIAKEYFELSNSTAIEFVAYAGILFQLQNYYQSVGLYQKALALNQLVLDGTHNKEIESDACNHIGVIYYILEKYDEAMIYLNKSLKIREKLPNKAKLAEIQNNISPLYKHLKAYPTALRHLNESLEIRTQLKDLVGQSITLNNMGQVYLAKSDYKIARECLDKSLKIQQDFQEPKTQATLLSSLAYIDYMEGYETAALNLFETALALQEQINDLSGKANTLQNLGAMYFAHKNWKSSIECYLKASAALELMEINDSPNQQNILQKLNMIAQTIGEKEFEQIVYHIRTKPV